MAEHEAGFGIIGRQFDRGGDMALGAGEVASLHQCDAQLGLAEGVFRVELGHLAAHFDRLGVPLLRRQHIAETDVEVQALRVDRDRLPPSGFGCRRIAGAQVQFAEMRMKIEPLRIEADRLTRRGDRLVRFPGAAQHMTQVEVKYRGVRRQFDRLSD